MPIFTLHDQLLFFVRISSFLHSYSLMFVFSYQVGNLATTSSSSTSFITSLPPSPHIQLWLSALSHISAHQIVVSRLAFTLVCGMGTMSPVRSGRGWSNCNPSSKCVKCILNSLFLRFHQIQCISVAGVNGAQIPLYTPPSSFFFSRNFFHKRIWFYFLFHAKTCVFHTVSVVLVLTSPACVRNFAK